ncbi:MAG: ArsR family transcriptional regulator [Anaerolineales bacterium]
MVKSLRDEINILHAQVCSGLADPNRILILYELADGPHNVSDLSATLDIPQPNSLENQIDLARSASEVIRNG